MNNAKQENLYTDSLLSAFNRREQYAFCKIYEAIYDEVYYFADKIYRDTEISAKDIIHDIFIKIWESKKTNFKDIVAIKGYMYISIRNGFRDYISHKKCVGKFTNYIKADDEYLVSAIVETETVSIINEAINLLPTECAKIFKMFIDGCDIVEIAEVLNKKQSTVYTQRKRAISILKEKFPKDKLLVIISLINL